jgi:hypothetical protein
MMLWRWDHETRQWRAHPLQLEQAVSLSPYALLLPLPGGRCGLFAREQITVNGFSSLPLRILADRDEIRVGEEAVYFSLESAAEVVPFTAQATEVFCGRCKGKMKDGEAAVPCPRCKAWHHQAEMLSCWTYDAKCSSCAQPTAGISWQPEPLAASSPCLSGDAAILAACRLDAYSTRESEPMPEEQRKSLKLGFVPRRG